MTKKKDRYFLATKTDGEWERIEKRGYGDRDFAGFNAEQLSQRNGGTEIAILFKGEVKEIYFKGKVKADERN